MGGRGASSGMGREGGGGNINVLSTSSMVSERETNREAVDQVLGVAKDFNEKYGYIINDLYIATLDKKNTGVMGYYDGAQNIAINKTYMNAMKMNNSYDECDNSGWHPSRGNKTGLEAVTAHEYGHAITDAVGQKMGFGDIDQTAKKICEQARKQTGNKGVVIMAHKISRYASASNAETIAEAVSDVYCNGKNACKESKAIVSIIDGYLK